MGENDPSVKLAIAITTLTIFGSSACTPEDPSPAGHQASAGSHQGAGGQGAGGQATGGQSTGGQDAGGQNAGSGGSSVGGALPKDLLGPEHLVYRGAFRVPDSGAPTPASFSWGGKAMTYYPKGDPTGTDSTIGSLIMAGVDNEWPGSAERSSLYSEITIPEPVITTNPNLLPTATTLQGFVDLRGSVYQDSLRFELVKAGIQYLPAIGNQSSDMLYLTWGQHIEDVDAPGSCAGNADPGCVPSHGWRPLGPNGELNAHPSSGAWWVADTNLYTINDYLFEIPEAWAAQHTGGRRLASGRMRDGGQGFQ